MEKVHKGMQIFPNSPPSRHIWVSVCVFECLVKGGGEGLCEGIIRVHMVKVCTKIDFPLFAF